MSDVASVRVEKDDMEVFERNSVSWCRLEAAREYDSALQYLNSTTPWEDQGEPVLVRVGDEHSAIGIGEIAEGAGSAWKRVIGAPPVGYVLIAHFMAGHQEGDSTDEVTQYSTILHDLLAPLSFSLAERYEDKLGGSVLDAFCGQDRVTLVIDLKGVQVLSYIGGQLNDKLLERSRAMKSEVIMYIGNLLGRGSEAVEASRRG